MTKAKRPRTDDADPGVNQISPEQAHRAALEVARRFGDQPALARELLAMLGVGDLVRAPRQPPTTPAGRADPAELLEPLEPCGAGSPLVDTGAAAEALHMLEDTLNRFAEARIVRPVRSDPDGARWWRLHDLRRQVSSYLGDHENPPGPDRERRQTQEPAHGSRAPRQ